MHQATIRSGRTVGALATELFVGGARVVADHEHHDDAVRETERLMADEEVSAIFEAGFVHERVGVRVDVLERGAAGCWNVVEVKSSLDVKEISVDDLALQCWVLRGCGVEVGRAELMTLDRGYQRRGNLELARLFVRHDCTQQVNERLDRVSEDLERFTGMLCASSPPAVRPAHHCWDPFPCPYRAHCFDEVGGGHPLTELPGLSASRRARLAERGICDIAGIPDGEPLSDVQARVRECVCTGEEYVSDELARVLDELEAPVHHLRIGVLRPAVPRCDDMRPYQLLPYVWSDHVEDDHRQWMGESSEDPRVELARALLAAVGDRGSVCVFGSVERKVITALAKGLPDLATPLRSLADRLVDLQGVAMAHYYHPDLRGCFEAEPLAAVLRVPTCRGQGSLRDEFAAGVLYEESLVGSAEMRDAAHERVLRYFGRCTEAMQKLRVALRARAG